MTKVVVLDAGHGGHDPGAVANGLKEKDLTLDIVKRTINKLKKYNVKVIATRTTDKFISLSGRASTANRNKADLFVSVHINSGGGTGFESFIYNGSIQSSTKSFQHTLHKAIMNKINVKDRGKKSANFAVVRETNMPAVLTENLFVDGDNKSLNKNSVLDNLAQGHADGIAEFLGLKKSSTSSKSKPINKPSKPTKTPGKSLGLVDWMKSKGMDSSYSNRKKLAAQYGIKGYKGTASQNNKLLSKLKAGKPKPSKPSKPTKKGDQTTNSIVDYLKSIGENSSLSNRKKLAKKYGISNYSGTSAQNTKLLKAMRGGAVPKKKTTTALKVGNTVTLKKSATHFATGQSILNSAKGKKYKILQVKSDRVLLDNIMSWVKKSDVQ